MVVHRLFENQVEKGPHHLAVIGADGSGLTYRELNRKANKLAYTLRKRGFRTGGFIAVIMEHSLEMIVAVMGILKAGAAYVPLEPGLPPARIKQVLTSIQVGAAVTGGSALRMSEDIWKHRQPGYLKTVLCLTKTPILNTAADELFKDKELVLAEEIDSSPGDNLVSTTRPGDIAYVIHTSGSTGTPKGVVESHQPVVNIIQWVNRTFDIGDLDKLLFVTSLGFDLSVYDIFGILASGASIRVASPEDIRDPGRLSGIIYDEGITFWDSAPAALKLLITFLTESRWDPGASGLRLVFLSGDWIPVTMPDALRDIFANIRVISLGGATEATIWSNYYPVETVDPLWTSIPYGKPIQNSVYYILDLYMNPCLIGVPGDLYIGGPCLASGYINDVELTAGKFIRNPFIPGRNMYKTGDLARWYNDGNMEFLGRKDHQVKIRGYRVELGDIESHLLEHEYIKEAVVLASKGDKEEKSAEKFLCAYITAHKELAITGLREYLARYLPAYMIPAYFVQMEHIPLNSNGKIDRKRLPAPGAKPGIECAAPRDEMEKILTEVWREVLAVQNIGIDDDFFELGGDSIKSIQIASSLKKYGFKLKVRDVFGKSTIRELATCVDKIRRTAFQGVVEGEVPLTPIQQWFFQNPFTHCHHFNHAVMLYRQKGFDESILNDVFRCITLHHDALRIVYSREHAGNRVVQVNQGKDAPAFHLEVIHIHGNENIEVKIEKEANRLQACIDLEKGGLVKIGLFKTPYGDHLLIVIHHLVVDGVSWRILLEDLELGISQAERGEDIKFREKTDSYKYWSEKLREYAAGSSLSSSMDYWKALEETTVEPLPGDKQVSPGERKIKYNGTIVINLDETETAKLLKDVHRAYNTEINDILLAALALGIREWAGLDKVAVDLEGHGRESIAQDLDVSRTVGWFTSLYPVVLDLGQANQPAFAVKSVKETLRKIPGNGIDYGVLKYLVPGYKKQEPGFSLRPEISFNYLGQFHPQHAHGSDSFSFSPMKTGNSINPQLERQYAIDITGILVKGQLTVSFSYSRYKYRAAAIEQLANAYRSNLLKIIDHCVKKEERETTPADLAAGEELSLGELEDIKQFTELYISE
jgi:amino acid adenylation domain-containing protein/non-ribosomal peptide synthase protein (TIGR01720 family)